uniref:Uncharacterized protein n=1 Tax=Anguilla anguilla TaxID=7936 RepID=A0A0E9VYJ7_ANGAN
MKPESHPGPGILSSPAQESLLNCFATSGSTKTCSAGVAKPKS